MPYPLPPDGAPEQDGRDHHNDAEKVETAASDQQSTGDAADIEPPSELPAPSGKKYSFFTTNEKRAIVFAAAAGAFFSPLSAQIYFPALETLSRDLHISITEVNLTVTTYMVSYR